MEGKSVWYLSGKTGLAVAFYGDILPSGARKGTESVHDYTYFHSPLYKLAMKNCLLRPSNVTKN